MIPSPGSPGDGWSRLSPRKLLLDPVKAIGQAIVPVVVAAGRRSAGATPASGGWSSRSRSSRPLLLGALPWLTTHYRLTDTQIQVRSGMLNKNTSTAPLDRVRSVDLEASLLHRVLGLQKVQVGTGVDDDRITLDALRRRTPRHCVRRCCAAARHRRPSRRPTASTPRRRARGPGRRTGRGPGRARPDRLVVAALRALQPRPPRAPGRRRRRALPVRRRPADLERGDRALDVGLGHAVRPGRGRRSSSPSAASRSGSSCRSRGTSSSGGASSWCASTGRCTSPAGCSPPARSRSRRPRSAASR